MVIILKKQVQDIIKISNFEYEEYNFIGINKNNSKFLILPIKYGTKLGDNSEHFYLNTVEELKEVIKKLPKNTFFKIGVQFF